MATRHFFKITLQKENSTNKHSEVVVMNVSWKHFSFKDCLPMFEKSYYELDL